MIYAFYFLQVTYGLLEAFSFVRWPDALEDIAKYSEVLQLNFLQMAPLHCLIRGIKVSRIFILRDNHKTKGRGSQGVLCLPLKKDGKSSELLPGSLLLSRPK